MSGSVILPTNPLYLNHFLRALSHASSLGSDAGECFRALRDAGTSITPITWSTAWAKMASLLDRHAESLLQSNPPQKLSARHAFLRASNYYRTAYSPSLGYPLDTNTVLPLYRAMSTSFSKAAMLFDPPLEPLEIPFKGVNLRGYLAKPPPGTISNGRLMVVIGGYDSTMEELYSFNSHHTLIRGYSVIVFDGPGQGGTLLELNMPISHNYDEVLQCVLDVAATRGSWKHTVVTGLSFGGLLCLKAVAPLQNRIHAVVADPGELNLIDAFRGRLPFPQSIREQLPEKPGWAVPLLSLILNRLAGGQNMVGWALRRGMLVHGKTTPIEYTLTLKEFDNGPFLEKIQCPTLITKAEDDDIAGQAEVVYEKLTSCNQRSLLRFSAEEGAGEHCESGARMFYSEKVFAWLDKVLLDV